jgi:hypothetical protein
MIAALVVVGALVFELSLTGRKPESVKVVQKIRLTKLQDTGPRRDSRRSPNFPDPGDDRESGRGVQDTTDDIRDVVLA